MRCPVELGVIIGKPGRDIPKGKAFDHVAGYCLAIDYTARNVQDAAKAKSLPWSAAKGFDTHWLAHIHLSSGTNAREMRR